MLAACRYFHGSLELGPLRKTAAEALQDLGATRVRAGSLGNSLAPQQQLQEWEFPWWKNQI